MGNKDDRLQIRIDPEDKEFLKDYSKGRGGMSRVIQSHVQELRVQKRELEEGDGQERARN